MSKQRKPKLASADMGATPPGEEYTVLARRYRPQQFDELIGQEAVAQALINALQTNRVAHAYLFTGTRGVGKTSTARILAKALNCEKGPTSRPCDQCDICRSIASGEDVDVLEIDGASNRGIDEVREIRQNVQYRPSRSRYKIYIIDEVHMLTSQAFNALLKTLEEPPSHVKFIFATTEVQKIPITILSRCQRFDFAGINTSRIVDRLQEVAAAEGVAADHEALELVARRAGGSMRDAQSILDQLLAFGTMSGTSKLTAEDIHRLLGTAHDEQVMELAQAVLEQTPEKTLSLLDQAVEKGLQLGELVDQLISYWRDLMIANCSGGEGVQLAIASRHQELVRRQAASLQLDSILAGLDVLSATKARLRASSHARVLIEMALVRLGRLGNLVSLAQVAQWLEGATSSRLQPSQGKRTLSTPTKEGRPVGTRPSADSLANEKKNSIEAPRALSPSTSLSLTDESLPRVWSEVLAQVGPMLAGNLEKAETIAISGPNALAIRFSSRYTLQGEHCVEPNRLARAQEVVRKLTGQDWVLRIETVIDEAAAPLASAAETENSQSRYRRQRTEAMREPLVKRAFELLGAQIVQVDDGFGAAPATPSEPTETAEAEEL